MKKLIGYVRVSTDEQGTAGNGLEAQRAAIEHFAATSGYTLLNIVTEVASGKLGLEDRPVLKQAIADAQKQGAVLVVSKLDRLSREALFILTLMQSKAKFIVTQFGESVDEFMLHMYAVLGEKERKMIGQRTRDALAQLKFKGIKLGGPRLAEVRIEGSARNANKADAFAMQMKPAISRMLAFGMSFNAIAAEFNTNGTKTARGGLWTATTVKNIVARMGQP